MDRSYIVRNNASRERLQRLLASLGSDEMNLRIDDAWTVSALLAHLAFWDRFVFERWKQAERGDHPVPQVLDDVLPDIINAASLPQWRTMEPSIAASEAIQAATAVDWKIEQLSTTAVEAVLASGRLALIDRSVHREPHLDEIERALRAAI